MLTFGLALIASFYLGQCLGTAIVYVWERRV